MSDSMVRIFSCGCTQLMRKYAVIVRNVSHAVTQSKKHYAAVTSLFSLHLIFL